MTMEFLCTLTSNLLIHINNTTGTWLHTVSVYSIAIIVTAVNMGIWYLSCNVNCAKIYHCENSQFGCSWTHEKSVTDNY